MIPKDKYDVVVIGSGVAGLLAGTALAQAGMKVLIVEKNDKVGGCCVSFKRRGFKFDAGAHIIGSCGKGQILGDIFEKLNIKLDFVRFDPTDRIHFPGRSFDIPAGIDAIKASLKEKFPKEADNIEHFFDLMAEAKNNLVAAHLFSKYKGTTYKNLLDQFFEDALLKNVLSFGCGYVGLPPSKLSALSALFLLRSYLFEGAYYPKGGSQEFSNAIARSFKKYGGKIILENRVQKIICRNNKAESIVFGENTVKCDYVISNADCRQTFNDLVGVENIKTDTRLLQKLNTFLPSESFFIMYIAVKGGYDLKGKSGWHFGDYDVDKEYYNLIYMQIPTLMDSSIAPKGKNIIEMGIPFPFAFKEVKNWEKTKKDLAVKSLESLERLLPGIKNYIIFYEAATPMTLYKYTSNDQGAPYGWEQNPEQVFANSFPSSSSAIENLILTGHWTFPGGGIVSSAFSGMIAVHKILKNTKIDSALKEFFDR